MPLPLPSRCRSVYPAPDGRRGGHQAPDRGGRAGKWRSCRVTCVTGNTSRILWKSAWRFMAALIFWSTTPEPTALKTFLEFPDEGWQRVIDVNMNAVYYLGHEVAKVMVKQGGGKIINIGSALSYTGDAKCPAYVTAKHGVIGITRSFANELGTVQHPVQRGMSRLHLYGGQQCHQRRPGVLSEDHRSHLSRSLGHARRSDGDGGFSGFQGFRLPQRQRH